MQIFTKYLFNCSNCRLSGYMEMNFSHICQHYCGKDEATHLWTQFNPKCGSRTEVDMQNFVRHLWSNWTSSYSQGTLTVSGGEDTSESSVLADSCKLSMFKKGSIRPGKWTFVLKAGIHFKGGAGLLDKHPAGSCAHTREWRWSVFSGFFPPDTSDLYYCFKNKSQSPQTECGVD